MVHDVFHCHQYHLYLAASAISLVMVRCHWSSFVDCHCDWWCYCSCSNCVDSASMYYYGQHWNRCRSVTSHIHSMWMPAACDDSYSYQRYGSNVANDNADDVDCELFVFWGFCFCFVRNIVAFFIVVIYIDKLKNFEFQMRGGCGEVVNTQECVVRDRYIYKEIAKIKIKIKM